MAPSQFACLVIVIVQSIHSRHGQCRAVQDHVHINHETWYSVFVRTEAAVYKRIGRNAGLPPSAVEEVEAKRKRAPRRLRINLCHENKEVSIEGSIILEDVGHGDPTN
jgi:hypothetical protein